ncbi:MAG: thioredoxin family protein [Erysipelotrichaceae bacterium]|nr:thioredoxin family protein [Erysipelotrichaceae bacterium]
MKKLICFLMIGLLLCSCAEKKTTIEDLKTQPNDMMSYETMKEPSDRFLELTMEESLRLFEEKGSGILLISRPSCPHCLNAVPVLAELAEKHELTIYYVNCAMGFENEHLEKLEVYAANVLGQRGVLVPIVFSIINGEAVGKHIGTVAGEDGLLTDEQWDKTIEIYEKLLKDWIK